MKGPTYIEHDGWRRYQPHLPERYRLSERNLPGEQSWPWDGLQVHLDRYETPDPAAVIVGCTAVADTDGCSPDRPARQRLGLEAVLPDMPGYGLSPVPRRRSPTRTGSPAPAI